MEKGTPAPEPEEAPEPEPTPEPEFCTQTQFDEGNFQDEDGNWCEGQDLCADEENTEDANGDACPVPEPEEPTYCTADDIDAGDF